MINDVLLVSSFASREKIEYIRKISNQNPGYAIQKFTRLLAEGFKKNGIRIRVLSVLSVNRNISKKTVWNPRNDEDCDISFEYVPFLNIGYIRQLCIYIWSFFKVLFYRAGKNRNKVVICDALCRSACLGALTASRITNVRCIGILTDMPGMVTKKAKVNRFVAKRIKKIQYGFLHRFDALVYITKYMAEEINLTNIPSIIMEGSVDYRLVNEEIENSKNTTRDIVYAGCIHERHGLKLLVEAFMRLKDKDLRLLLFGDGAFCEKLPQYIAKDKRIEYRGVVPNDVIVEAERKATLLVNPRPSDQEFTYYSFPSKNHEYMVSGTPVLTTKLPCFPHEYLDYLYFFEDETIEGMYRSLEKVLSLDSNVLREKGKECRDFVLREKNNIIQSKRILDLAESI